MKVLIVDDETLMQELLSDIFEEAGNETRCSSNGRDAIQCYADFAPDVIVLDVMMPQMNGFEFCKHIRDVVGDKETPILMLTGMGGAEIKNKGLAHGANDVFFKPINGEKLVHYVESIK